jgi:hypothetical protein
MRGGIRAGRKQAMKWLRKWWNSHKPAAPYNPGMSIPPGASARVPIPDDLMERLAPFAGRIRAVHCEIHRVGNKSFREVIMEAEIARLHLEWDGDGEL